MREPDEYLSPPPREDLHGYREDYGPGRYLPATDSRYGYDCRLGSPPPGGDFSRPVALLRDYRDHPAGPVPVHLSGEYEDHKMRGPLSLTRSWYACRSGVYPSDPRAFHHGYSSPDSGLSPVAYDVYDMSRAAPGESYLIAGGSRTPRGLCLSGINDQYEQPRPARWVEFFQVFLGLY